MGRSAGSHPFLIGRTPHGITGVVLPDTSAKGRCRRRLSAAAQHQGVGADAPAPARHRRLHDEGRVGVEGAEQWFDPRFAERAEPDRLTERRRRPAWVGPDKLVVGIDCHRFVRCGPGDSKTRRSVRIAKGGPDSSVVLGSLSATGLEAFRSGAVVLLALGDEPASARIAEPVEHDPDGPCDDPDTDERRRPDRRRGSRR